MLSLAAAAPAVDQTATYVSAAIVVGIIVVVGIVLGYALRGLDEKVNGIKNTLDARVDSMADALGKVDKSIANLRDGLQEVAKSEAVSEQLKTNQQTLALTLDNIRDALVQRMDSAQALMLQRVDAAENAARKEQEHDREHRRLEMEHAVSLVKHSIDVCETRLTEQVSSLDTTVRELRAALTHVQGKVAAIDVRDVPSNPRPESSRG